jgi:acyl carrier protein
MTKADAVLVDREELRGIVADVLDVPVEDVTDDANFSDDLEVDSLMALEVMVVLERRYHVKLQESRLKEVTSLSRAYDLLSEELGRR